MKDKKDKSIKDIFLKESENSAGLDVTAVPVLFSADIYPACIPNSACIPNTACIRNTGKKVNHYIFGVKKASSASIQDSDCEALKCSLENSNEPDNKEPDMFLDENKNFPVGIIEGFFGTPWSMDSRLALISQLNGDRIGFYIYAPKNDSRLRKNWMNELPENYIRELNILAESAHNRGIKFGIGFSPLGATKNLEMHLPVLRKQISTFAEKVQLDYFALLFDDMQISLEHEGSLQNSIIRECYSIVSKKNIHLIVCSSYYTTDPILEKVFGKMPATYYRDLLKDIPADVDLFWTGSKVISTDYTEEDLELATKLLGRKPFIWDNYPVNDGKKASDYIYLQPFTNRQNLIRFCSGIAVNPMKQTFLNLIPLANITRAILNLNDCNKQYEKLENNFSDSVLKRYPDLLKSFIIKYHDLLAHTPLPEIDTPVKNEMLQTLDDICCTLLTSLLKKIEISLHQNINISGKILPETSCMENYTGRQDSGENISPDQHNQHNQNIKDGKNSTIDTNTNTNANPNHLSKCPSERLPSERLQELANLIRELLSDKHCQITPAENMVSAEKDDKYNENDEDKKGSRNNHTVFSSNQVEEYSDGSVSSSGHLREICSEPDAVISITDDSDINRQYKTEMSEFKPSEDVHYIEGIEENKRNNTFSDSSILSSGICFEITSGSNNGIDSSTPVRSLYLVLTPKTSVWMCPGLNETLEFRKFLLSGYKFDPACLTG